MTFLEAIAKVGIITDMYVSKRTYQYLLSDIEDTNVNLAMNPSVVGGFMASFSKINIFMSEHMPDWKMLVFNSGKCLGIIDFEPSTITIARIEIDPNRPGVWKAFDAEGQFLWHITDEGAHKLSTQSQSNTV